jgi:hypothetical protein
MSTFNPAKARLNKQDTFQRFRVKDSFRLSDLVEQNKLREDDELLILERNDRRLAFSVFQMAYHHVAQGELAGQPYLVNF